MIDGADVIGKLMNEKIGNDSVSVTEAFNIPFLQETIIAQLTNYPHNFTHIFLIVSNLRS